MTHETKQWSTNKLTKRTKTKMRSSLPIWKDCKLKFEATYQRQPNVNLLNIKQLLWPISTDSKLGEMWRSLPMSTERKLKYKAAYKRQPNVNYYVKQLTNVMRTQSMTWMLPRTSASRIRVVAKTQAIEIPKFR
jgi:hypothetical protein